MAMSESDSCDMCKRPDNVIKVCLGCTKKLDFNKLVVLGTLLGSRLGLTVGQIANRSGLHRNTIGKHITALDRDGLIIVKHYGNTRFCRIPGKHVEFS